MWVYCCLGSAEAFQRANPTLFRITGHGIYPLVHPLSVKAKPVIFKKVADAPYLFSESGLTAKSFGSLAMFAAMRHGEHLRSSRVGKGIPPIDVGERLAGSVHNFKATRNLLDRPRRGKASGHARTIARKRAPAEADAKEKPGVLAGARASFALSMQRRAAITALR
jgi:hypothetical protein